jgi:hypothetical protein
VPAASTNVHICSRRYQETGIRSILGQRTVFRDMRAMQSRRLICYQNESCLRTVNMRKQLFLFIGDGLRVGGICG